MIKTKHGSRVEIIDTCPSFGEYERVWIEFVETGFVTDILTDYLVEDKKGEIREAIERLKKGEEDL